MVLPSDIEKALGDLISNEEGMKFQGLAVVLAKQRWPDLIACERKKDLGADAIAKAPFASEGGGKVLVCSITAKFIKVREDAKKIREHFKGITRIIFATPARITNETGEKWAAEIAKDFGYELTIMSREDIITSLMHPSNASLLKTHLGIHVEVERTLADLVEQVRAATAEVTTAWSMRIAGRPLLELRGLKLEPDGRDSRDILQLSDIGNALDQGGRVVLEGPAGRGKTTTLIQLAKAGRARIPFLIDLPQWAASKIAIFQFIAGMPQFQARSLDAATLARVITVEHCWFLLNGWNEVGESEFLHAESALRALERDFPAAGILVATRTHHIVPPLPGAVRARLLTLTRTERTAYLNARLGRRAEKLCQKLDNDPMLDDLTRTPFFLSEVTSIFEAGAAIPATKIGVLDAVTGLVETSAEHRNHLCQPPLAGRASYYLGELAARMTAEGAVSISDAAARSAVNMVGTLLKDAGQIATQPEPAILLGTLCAHHILERQEYPVVSFRFEHQQFQEFYAALGARKQLWATLQTENDKKTREFTKLIVNEPAWAEPLRMIADDIRRRPESAGAADAIRAGKLLIQMALNVDPVFAAELSRLCGPQVWNEVRGDVSGRLRSLYAVPDLQYKHCALAGMLASGSDDFKDIIVPILSTDNQQDRLGTYRTWSEFHLSSLGPNWRDTVASWQEAARVEFVSEILRRDNIPEITSFARSDPSPKVKEAAIERLIWLGVPDEAVELLESIDPGIFESIVAKLDPELIPPTIRQRALTGLQKSFEASADPLVRLPIVLKQSKLGAPAIGEQLKQELSKVTGRIDNFAYPVIRTALDIVRATDTSWVSAWVAERVADGTLWHEAWNDLVAAVPEKLKEALLQRLETEDFKHGPIGNITSVLAAGADVAMAERVFLKLCQFRQIITGAPDERHEFEWAIERQLETLLRALASNIVLAGLSRSFSKAVDAVELDVITRVFSRVGYPQPDSLTELDTELRKSFRTYLKNAVPFVLQQDDFSGELKANLSSVLASVGAPEDIVELRQLIRADIERVKRGRAAWASGDRSRLGNGGLISYSTWHIRAVIRLDLSNAEAVLLDLLNESEYERAVTEELVRLITPSKTEQGFVRKVDYEQIWEARSGVREECNPERRKRCASAIRNRIDAICKEYSSAEQKRPYDFRLRALGVALAAIDSRGSADLVFDIMALPDEWDVWPRVSALEALLFNGVALPTEKTLAVIDSCLERFRKHGVQQQDEGVVIRLLCLLPFIDDPARGIEKMRQLISESRVYPYQLRAVVEAVGHCRCGGALGFLRELASDKARAEQLGDAWINAVAAVNDREAQNLLLSFVDPDLPGLPPEIGFGKDDVLASRILELGRCNKGVEYRILQLCDADLPSPKRLLLAKVIGRLGTLDAVLAGLKLIDDGANPPVPYEIFKQIEAAFVEQRPYGQSENTYTLEPRSSNAVRLKLLEMATKDERRKKSTLSLLAQIEEWRLEYGRPTGEPRHPALESGEPWPPMPKVPSNQPGTVDV